MTVNFSTDDFGKVGHALGVVDGIAYSVQTGVYAQDLVAAAGTYAADEIASQIDKMSLTSNANLSHVYEWNSVGLPSGRLFKVYPKGNGRSRVVTFNFTASKVSVPTLSEKMKSGKVAIRPNDPIFKPGKRSGRRVNPNARYIFHQKAQYMEYGGAVTISPKKGKSIFIPFERERNGRTYAFVPSSEVNFGQVKFRGRFHMAYKVATIHTGAKVGEMVDKLAGQDAKTTSLRSGKTGQKSVNLGFAEGQDYAKNRMRLAGNMAAAQLSSMGGKS